MFSMSIGRQMVLYSGILSHATKFTFFMGMLVNTIKKTTKSSASELLNSKVAPLSLLQDCMFFQPLVGFCLLLLALYNEWTVEISIIFCCPYSLCIHLVIPCTYMYLCKVFCIQAKVWLKMLSYYSSILSLLLAGTIADKTTIWAWPSTAER